MHMRTISGRTFDPLNVTEDDIVIEDIAHALSRLCRYGGHLPGFYSVAQHSVYAASYARTQDWPAHAQMQCLLHDASEAYLGDVIRPLKVGLPEYKDIEERLESVIWHKFMPGVLIDPGMIRIADEWTLNMEFVAIRPFADGWKPNRAKREFLTTYCDIQTTIRRRRNAIQ